MTSLLTSLAAIAKLNKQRQPAKAARITSKPGAQAVADWIRSQEGHGVRVASTEVFEDYQVLLSASPATKTKNRSEQAAAEVLAQELATLNQAAMLLFEDSGVKKQNFLVRLPDEVLVVSTSEFLHGLEAAKLLPSASAILQRATTLRGNEILDRHVSGTESAEPRTLPKRLGRGDGL